MKDKMIDILQSKLDRRDEQEKLHGVGRISHTIQIPLHIDEVRWLVDYLATRIDAEYSGDVSELIHTHEYAIVPISFENYDEYVNALNEEGKAGWIFGAMIRTYKDSPAKGITTHDYICHRPIPESAHVTEGEIVEKCKQALLKQLHYVIYCDNGYPIEAVPKATILSLDKLIKTEPVLSKGSKPVSEEDAGIDAATFARNHELHNEDGVFELLTDGYMGCYYNHVYKSRPAPISEGEVERVIAGKCISDESAKQAAKDVVELLSKRVKWAKKVSVKEIEHTIDNLQSKHDSWLGHDGEVGRSNFKSGLSWAIESFKTLISC